MKLWTEKRNFFHSVHFIFGEKDEKEKTTFLKTYAGWF